MNSFSLFGHKFTKLIIDFERFRSLTNKSNEITFITNNPIFVYDNEDTGIYIISQIDFVRRQYGWKLKVVHSFLGGFDYQVRSNDFFSAIKKGRYKIFHSVDEVNNYFKKMLILS